MAPVSLDALLTRGRTWPSVDHVQIVKRARILVIDDSDFPYLKLFRRDGYTIEKWSTVKSLPRIEAAEFDVILLDLFGVGAEQSTDHGFGVLEHIRKKNPAQIVVAYSNAEWSVEYQPFFDSADAVLHKTKTDYFEFKRTVDRLLDERFSLGFYIGRIAKEVGDSAQSLPKLEVKARRAILTGNPDTLTKYLKQRVEDAVTIDRVLQIVQIAIGAAQLWKG